MTDSETLLPAGFQDLEPLCAHWANESINDRANARLNSTFDELKLLASALVV